MKQLTELNEPTCIPGAPLLAGANKTRSRRLPWNPNLNRICLRACSLWSACLIVALGWIMYSRFWYKRMLLGVS